jgi:V-type H+-transporting ATPase subunit a
MQLVQLFVQIEAAHDTVDELGNLGLIQFRDLNPDVNAFQRNFVIEVKRCDEMERKLRFFEEQVTKEKGLARALTSISVESAGPSSAALSMDELETRFDELEKELQQMINNQQMLDRNYNELIELQHVLSADAIFFSESEDRGEGFDARSPLLADAQQESGIGKAVKLGFVTGVIGRSKVASFERVLWRATRGNLFMRQSDIEEPIKDPQTGEEVEKNAFIIFFQGDRLQAKIKKICESFGATVYPCPENGRERGELLKQVSSRLQDLQVVLARTNEHRKQVLSSVAVHIQVWKAKVLKEKAIYHTMNMFNYDVGRKCLIAEGWCPQTATEDIQLALRRATQRSGALVPSILSVIPTDETPPTHFETSKYTRAFQEIVAAYGVAHYREINPAVFTIITFPFLFAVMFADVGHGLFLLAFALILIRAEKSLAGKKLNEIVQMPFDGRYALLLMSLFSIYIGFIYNEFFSIPMDIFGTNWNCDYEDPKLHYNSTYCVQKNPERTYPFGVDPAWKGAPNELDYYNSFKMKLSIILGIGQMSLGVILSALNSWNQKPPLKWLNLLTQFLPQIVFLWAIFGYMCLLILIKWCTNWYEHPPGNPEPILNVIINMFLSPTRDLAKVNAVNYLHGQQQIQTAFLILALISIPIMLLVKPFMLRHYHNQETHHRLIEHGDEEHAGGSSVSHHGGGGGGHGEHGEEFDFSEIMIHQIIHTIEYILGAISNTASYLRLWALSLAHSELSTVFWNRVLIGQVLGGNVFFIFIGFAVWAAATFAVLLIMETLSAFLHALRLHWVEFQNKFYIGDGVRFRPFSYERIMSGADDEE